MREIRKTVYTFSELTGRGDTRAVEAARVWLWEHAIPGYWYEHVYDMWKQALDGIGFTDPEIRFSGFGHQGSGASFTSHIDFPVLTRFLADEATPSESFNEDDPSGWIAHKLGRDKPTNPQYRKLAWLYEQSSDFIEPGTVFRCARSCYVHKRTCTYGGAGLMEAVRWVAVRIGEGYWESTTPRLDALFQGCEGDIEDLRQNLCDAIYRDLEQEYEYFSSDEYLAEEAELNGWYFDEQGQWEPVN